MKLKKWKQFKIATSFIALALALLSFGKTAAADPLTDNHFSVNFQNSDVSGLLSLLAAQTGLTLKADKDLGVLVTLNKTNVTAKEVLDQLSENQELEYHVVGNQLIVTKRSLGTSGSVGNVHHVALQYASATEVATKLFSIVPTTEKVLVDEHANAIMFVGSDSSWKKVSDVIGFLDVSPSQILIEARIVETSDEFLRDIGISFDAGSLNGNQVVSTINPITPATNMAYSGFFGANLDIKLAAAETRGDAKIISRPKVLTLNNQQAKIASGETINVKTLSTAISNPTVSSGSTSTGVPGLSATTGVTAINAGLTLDILPCIVGTDRIRLVVSINDSQADTSSSVDGIPAILSNGASTSIIVKNGETAIIAGLVKQSNTNTYTGVPVLSSIPLLGALFRTTSKADTNNELAIFITPTIDDGHLKMIVTPATDQGKTEFRQPAALKPRASVESPTYSPIE